jgi:hypothetical protein
MGYVYEGTLSRCMDLGLIKVNSVGEDGVWITVYDEEGMECEVQIAGLTPDVLRLALYRLESRGR